MAEPRVYNFIHKKFKVFHSRRFLIFISILIPLTGLSLDLLKITDIAFARSGSIMVALAIASVFINHFVGKEIEHARGIYKSVSQMGNSPEEIEKRLNPSLKENRMRTALTMHLLSSNAKNDLTHLIKVESNIVVAEFTCGFFGTLIWGFGDLVV